jgi:hypothetical protein
MFRGKRGIKGKTHQWRKEVCPICGQRYKDLKTGLSWNDVYLIARKEHEAGKRGHYSRGTILGIWFSIKQQMWNNHLEECRLQALYESENDS